MPGKASFLSGEAGLTWRSREYRDLTSIRAYLVADGVSVVFPTNGSAISGFCDFGVKE